MYVMMWYFILIITLVTSNADINKDGVANYDDAIDPIIDMLLNPDTYEELKDHEKLDNDNKLQEIDGLWMCGDCTNISKTKPIYNEYYDFDINDDGENIDIQIGLSVKEMRCVTLKTEHRGQVYKTSGACDSEVTFRIVDSKHCDVNVYG